MPTDAYWAVACIALAFCLTLALSYNVNARKALRQARSDAARAEERHKGEVEHWKDAWRAKAEHLDATRIALKEAQKNDRRGPNGRFIKAS